MMKILRLSLLVSAPLLLTACVNLAPDYQPPAIDLGAQYSQQVSFPSIDSDAANDQAWWRAFNDPVLDKLVQGVLQQNLTLAIARGRVQEARARLGIAQSFAFPQGTLVFDAKRLAGSEHSALTYTSRPYSDYTLGFDAGWELDLFGRVASARQTANWQLNAADAQLADLQRIMAAEAAKIYINYRVLQRRLALAEKAVDIQEQSLRIAKALRQDGPATELDVQQATAILADTRALIPALNIAITQVRNSLIGLLGIPAAEIEHWLPSEMAPVPVLQIWPALDVPASLLARRPDIRHADFNARAAAAAVGVARADQYPRIQLLGSLRLRVTSLLPNEANPMGGSDFSDLFDGSALSFGVGPALTFPLFDFGQRANNARAAESQFEQALNQYRQTVWNALQDVETAAAQLRLSAQRVNYLRQSSEAYVKAQRIARIQYQEGETGFQSVLDSMRAVVLQEQNLAQEEGNIALAQVNLFKALGGGWFAKPTDASSKNVESN